jgi:hypothetical protein
MGMKVQTHFKNGVPAGHLIYCPACKRSHLFGTEWKFNDDFDEPTFNPSLNIEAEGGRGPRRCHFFVRDGIIDYCGDSTHAFRGKAIYMEDYQRSMFINNLLPRKVISLPVDRARALVAFCKAEKVKTNDKLRDFLLEGTHTAINEWTFDQIRAYLTSEEVYPTLREICAKQKAEAISIVLDAENPEIIFDRANVPANDKWVV